MTQVTKTSASRIMLAKPRLALSTNPAENKAVGWEVETALEEERRRGQVSIFPIRLDDAVTNTPRAWASEIRRTRHIGDFRGWKDASSYTVALEKLVRDLRQVA